MREVTGLRGPSIHVRPTPGTAGPRKASQPVYGSSGGTGVSSSLGGVLHGAGGRGCHGVRRMASRSRIGRCVRGACLRFVPGLPALPADVPEPRRLYWSGCHIPSFRSPLGSVCTEVLSRTLSNTMPQEPAHTPAAPADEPLIPGTRKGNLYARKDGFIAKDARLRIKRLKKELATERRRVTVLKQRFKALERTISAAGGLQYVLRYRPWSLKLEGEEYFRARIEMFYEGYEQGRNSSREEWNRWLRTSLHHRPKTQYEDDPGMIDPFTLRIPSLVSGKSNLCWGL